LYATARQRIFADASAIRPYHLEMDRNVAIIGAGVSGLTCGVVFAERGYRTAIFAKETGQQTTSSVAAAVWFPYHVEPAERVIPLARETYQVLVGLAAVPESGVSIIESRQFLRAGEIEIPDWAIPLGASVSPTKVGSGAAGEAATWTGRPEAERTGSERIKSRCNT
jgi:D-amino-acid oxidase